MLITYGFSFPGKSHIEKGSSCQDSNAVKILENGWVIAAVADGVGSAVNSGTGSRIAVDSVIEVFENDMPENCDTESLKALIRAAFIYALKQIMKEARSAGMPPESYDTTLTAVLYDGHRAFYGHSGDGALIGLDRSGSYRCLTSPQKGNDGFSVIPLRSGKDMWEIGSYDEEFCSLMLVTDGVLDGICNYLLREDPENSPVYVPLAAFFSDPAGFGGEERNADSIGKISELLSAAEDYDSEPFYDRLSEIYKVRVPEDHAGIVGQLKKNGIPPAFIKRIRDDKTLVGIINTDCPGENREADYYSEPDWRALQESWNRRAYPCMYTEEKTDSAPKKHDRNKNESA